MTNSAKIWDTPAAGRYGFETLGQGRIIQGVRSANLNAVKLMRRLGFRIEKGLSPEQTIGILDNYALWRQTYALN